MTSYVTARFRRALSGLPPHIRQEARDAYMKFLDNPRHASLHFKCVHTSKSVWSARVGYNGYRALGIRDGGEIVWFWIGNHNDYLRTIAQL